MRSIRENQLKRIKIKCDFLKEMGSFPPQIEESINGVANIEMARKVGKEVRDRNWPKIDLIEKVFDSLLRVMKEDLNSGECENCDKCDDKVKIIDQLLGQGDEYNPTSLENITPLGEC